jgi:hypothetical protein
MSAIGERPAEERLDPSCRHHAENQQHDEYRHEDIEQHPRDVGGCCRYPAKSEYGGNNRNEEKYKSPPEQRHYESLLCAERFTLGKTSRELSGSRIAGAKPGRPGCGLVFGEVGPWRPAADLLENTQKGIKTLVRLGDAVASGTGFAKKARQE